MKKSSTIFDYLCNKLPSLMVLAWAIYAYGLTPVNMPFAELAYTGITVLSVITLAPILRLLVFFEAAAYAESGRLVRDLTSCEFRPALVHYWFATALCYAAPIVCIATISK